MSASISSRLRTRGLALAAIIDVVLSTRWIQLAVFHVMLSSSIEGTASWLNIRQTGKYLVASVIVILSAQRTASRCSIHISFS